MTVARDLPARAQLPDWTLGERCLLVHHCMGCGRRWYLRRTFCPECGSPDVDAAPASGQGTIAAVTIVRRRQGASEPVGIALVDLVEGVRVMGRCPLDAVVGQRVTLGFEADESRGTRLLVPFFG